MAIKIPSKNIYKKQNPKVRDNVIERIEVGAVEVAPNNEYEISVYNKDLLSLANNYSVEEIKDEYKVDLKTDESGGEFPGSYYAVVLIDNKNTYIEGTLTIPKQKNNKSFISRIYNEQNGENDVGISIHSIKKSQSAYVSYINPAYDVNNPQEPYFSNKSYGDDVFVETQSGLIKLPFVVEKFYYGANAKVQSLPDNTNPIVSFKETENYYSIQYKVLYSVEISYFKGVGYRAWLEKLEIPCTGEKLIYEADKIEITVYGDTIGIDLTDKTVYINGETQKKVHSVEGNELMQTSNYIIPPNHIKLEEVTDYTVEFYSRNGVDYADIYLRDYVNYLGKKVLVRTYENPEDLSFGTVIKDIVSPTVTVDNGGYYLTKVEVFLVDDNAINSSFVKIQKDYEKGKETATIRCSISDYYDFDSGEKIISIDKSTGNMSFKMYDEVIPMVYTSDGKDKPMSVYKDGTPKVFRVLGTKIYYDGAVWQELSLQEI